MPNDIIIPPDDGVLLGKDVFLSQLEERCGLSEADWLDFKAELSTFNPHSQADPSKWYLDKVEHWDPAYRDRAVEILSLATQLGALRESNVPKTVLLNHKTCSIGLVGFAWPLSSGGWADNFRVVIRCHKQRESVVIPLKRAGDQDKDYHMREYLLLRYTQIQNQLPSLYARLYHFGLFRGINLEVTKTVLLHRLIVAASGQFLSEDLEVHHRGACSKYIGGPPTFDCRVQHLEIVTKAQHRIIHARDGHIVNWVA